AIGRTAHGATRATRRFKGASITAQGRLPPTSTTMPVRTARAIVVIGGTEHSNSGQRVELESPGNPFLDDGAGRRAIACRHHSGAPTVTFPIARVDSAEVPFSNRV